MTIGDILDYLPRQQHLIIVLEDGSQLLTTPDLIRMDDEVLSLRIQEIQEIQKIEACSSDFVSLNENLLSFIKWEDEKPRLLSELKEMEVEE